MYRCGNERRFFEENIAVPDASMLFVIVRIDILLHDDMILRCQHVELGVLEDPVWVLRLGLSFFRCFALVRLLFEDSGLLIKFPLELGRLWIEPVIEGQALAKRAELPKAERKCTNDRCRFEHSHLLVQCKLIANVCQRDLPKLE